MTATERPTRRPLVDIRCTQCGKPMIMMSFNYATLERGFESISLRCPYCKAEDTRPFPQAETNARTARVLTQIYEISSPDEARAISEIGIDHIGVLVGDGEFPREQSLSQARDIGT